MIDKCDGKGCPNSDRCRAVSTDKKAYEAKDVWYRASADEAWVCDMYVPIIILESAS